MWCMKINPLIKANIRRYLETLLQEEKNKITITSSHELSQDELSTLFDSIPMLKKAAIEYKIDAQTMAGVIIKIGSKIIDLSLQGQLLKLKDYMYEIDR